MKHLVFFLQLVLFASFALAVQAEPTCRAAGLSCHYNADCCSGLCSGLLCEEGSSTGSAQCRAEGYVCADGNQCCSGVCNFGVCQTSAGGGDSCRDGGDSCMSDGECCSGFCGSGGACQ